jgi:hypothetical protein
MIKFYNLKYDCPEELKTITYDGVFKLSDFNKTSLFHPVKEFKHHQKIRNFLHTSCFLSSSK